MIKRTSHHIPSFPCTPVEHSNNGDLIYTKLSTFKTNKTKHMYILSPNQRKDSSLVMNYARIGTYSCGGLTSVANSIWLKTNDANKKC